MGASGAMSNGTILARAGSASVAMVADAMQRPVIICCETLKFVDRVQLDSITYNELADPDALAAVDSRPDLTALQGWQDQPQLGELNWVPCHKVYESLRHFDRQQRPASAWLPSVRLTGRKPSIACLCG